MEEGKGPGLPIRADVPWRMTGLGGQTGAPLSLCRYRQLLYITEAKTAHFISLSLASTLSLFAPPIIHSFSSSLTGAVSFSQFLQHAHTRMHTHKHTHMLYIFLRHPSPHPIRPLKETHFSFAGSSKSLFTLS